jgi:ABC-type polysaccharide/polyol phosphate transport system ATPase subunit
MNEEAKKEIEVIHLSKTFNIKRLKRHPALSHLVTFFKRTNKKSRENEAMVIKDISFKVLRGEILGIIGKNGSGKSTLLRIIAGIYQKDSGKVLVYNDIFYLTTLGLGLMEKLSMRENIFLLGSIMGLTQKNVKDIFDEIVEFSELQEFVDLQISQFSVGMIGRLGFSISVFCMQNKKNSILLLDEVFGSGADYAFENKAIQKMEQLIRGGATVVIVSHDLDIVQKYCDRVIWLDKGEIKEIGNPKDIIEKYKSEI